MCDDCDPDLFSGPYKGPTPIIGCTSYPCSGPPAPGQGNGRVAGVVEAPAPSCEFGGTTWLRHYTGTGGDGKDLWEAGVSAWGECDAQANVLLQTMTIHFVQCLDYAGWRFWAPCIQKGKHRTAILPCIGIGSARWSCQRDGFVDEGYHWRVLMTGTVTWRSGIGIASKLFGTTLSPWFHVG